MLGNILCIPLAYSMSYSLDIFNLILIVLSPCLTGFLFDLYPKFRAVLTSLVLPLFPSLTVPSLPCLHSLCSFIRECL